LVVLSRHGKREFKTLRISGTIGTLFGLALFAALPAKASTIDYAFKFTGAFSGNGDILVNSTKDSLGGYDILGISGAISGPTSGTITNLDTAPGTPNATGLFTDPVTGKQWSYNDVFFTGGVPFDNNGVLFNFGNHYVGNIYSIGTQLFLSVSQPSAFFSPGAEIQLTVAQTPLPASLPMFLTALGGLWLVMRRRNKKASGSGIELGQMAAT
jgi:hypothetical protein